MGDNFPGAEGIPSLSSPPSSLSDKEKIQEGWCSPGIQGAQRAVGKPRKARGEGVSDPHSGAAVTDLEKQPGASPPSSCKGLGTLPSKPGSEK